MRAWFAHHHTGILLRIECNRNIFVITFLPFRCNLLNEHLADFAFFPVGDVGVDLIHLVSAHTIGTLSRPQVTNCHHSNLLLWWNNEGTCKSSRKLVVTIRTQPVIDSIFINQLNSYHTTIEIGWRIVFPVLLWNEFINPISTTFRTIFKFCDVSHRAITSRDSNNIIASSI